ncbi:MAG: imidazole glycerol phosphate synthase subunit HisH [Candidatus Acidiferrum sp.]|jgi:imidazole glycerol phosphate synthase glutamine amidotransferase subunit
MNTITLLDYGAGNVPSVQRALERQGLTSERASTPQQIASAKILILPGVGHYAALIRALDENSLRQPLLEKINDGTPFLGICLGLQALFFSSDEAPELTGLQLLPGRVTTLPPTAKLPHMGWNTLELRRESRLLEGISEKDYFYFAHSYAARNSAEKSSPAIATSHHGADFIAVLEHENICAVQFHPEKSGAPGARLLANFLRIHS